jgi:hypothetical protein
MLSAQNTGHYKGLRLADKIAPTKIHNFYPLREHHPLQQVKDHYRFAVGPTVPSENTIHYNRLNP